MKKLLFILICCSLIPFGIYAQDTVTKIEVRKQQRSFLIPGRPWTVEVPIWLPGFAGTFAYGDVSIEGEDGVDPEHPIEPPPGGSIGEILSRLFTGEWYLKFFYMSKIAYEDKNFLVALDGIAGAVGNSVKFNYNNKEIIQANFQTINIRFIVGYRVVNVWSANKKFHYELYGYIGTRAHFQKIYSDLDGIINKLDINPTWFEPIFGLQNQFSWKRWFMVVQADYGGWFIDSKFSFQLNSFVYYRTGRLTSIKLGWNHLDLNHYRTFLREDYKLNLTLSGPSVGIAFHL